MSANEGSESGMSGMMMLVGLGLLTTPIMIVMQLMSTIITGERIALCVVLLAALALIGAYWMRKRWVPAAISAFVLAPLAVAAIGMWFHRDVSMRDQWTAVLPWFLAVLWIPLYFSRTPSVKAAFTR